MTSLLEDPLLWVLLVVLVAAVFAVTRARRTNIQLRASNNGLTGELTTVRGQLAELQAVYSSASSRHAADLEEVRKDAESATKATLKSAVGTLATLAEEQLALLDELQQKYGDDRAFLADLMLVDHTGSQFSRRTKGISVLCGGWLGRRDRDASVYDVARSAQGRIRGYERVRINSQANVAVSNRAVEPIAMVLAELLDNATKYSAPGSPVEINIQVVPTGICLIVDDAGLGMDQETKARAASLLTTGGAVDITSLGDPPKFGFALSGKLAAHYGFHVSVDAVSPYGGVRAVIRVPETLLTAEVPAPVSTTQEPSDHDEAEEVQPTPITSLVVGQTAGGLPKRRRRRNGSVTVVPSSSTLVPDEESSEKTASRLKAFARGTMLGRDSDNAEGPQNQ
ncbi:ATP-binding protein [Streptomyces sp. DSM 44915]|uniref:histidine kinase n=1 Tax=Streptomyces chisholmiae TaxID=3075540 RepID=A0ABU2JYI7_9ACTN|nr:ATP-binding protein [Streptomyces sp. DSM 44915]MDT0270055.1 ATP-binding protein [Streptomyces sp. DSM 44915]